MNKAFIFPGQGSQIVGMGKDFFDNISVAKEAFCQVDDILNYRLSDIIFNGPSESLGLTQHTQPALMTVSIAILKTILAGSGKDIQSLCSYVAGHSLGEYSALCAAESISLHDTANLLKTRGNSMQKASPVGQGAMAACIGMDNNMLQNTINSIINDGVCQIANDNVQGQIVISGHTANVERVVAALKDSGYKAIMLKVSAPFHSELMKPAEETMNAALNATEIKKPLVPIICNIDANPTSNPEAIRSNLAKQVCGTVKWRQTMDQLASLGVTELVEIGSGKVLSGIAAKSGHSFIIRNVSNVKEMEEFLGTI